VDGTSAAKVNLALVLSVTPSGAGPERMVVTGGDLTSHWYLAGVVSQLPATSLARTSRTWTRRVRSDHWSGEVHELYAVPFRAHWKVRVPGRLSVPVNVKVATVF
jgi:hypothetical protein